MHFLAQKEAKWLAKFLLAFNLYSGLFSFFPASCKNSPTLILANLHGIKNQQLQCYLLPPKLDVPDVNFAPSPESEDERL